MASPTFHRAVGDTIEFNDGSRWSRRGGLQASVAEYAGSEPPGCPPALWRPDQARSGAELGEPTGVGERERQQIFGLDLTETAAQTGALAKGRLGVRPAGSRGQQDRHGVPAVAAQRAG